MSHFSFGCSKCNSKCDLLRCNNKLFSSVIFGRIGVVTIQVLGGRFSRELGLANVAEVTG